MLSTPAPKFRLSCDSCLAAKVKCNKEKPTCERCRMLGKGCLYSVCRKTGRPSLAVRKRTEPRAPVTAYSNLAPKSPRDVLHINAPADWMVDGSVSDMNEPGTQFEWDDLGIDGLDPLSLLQSWGAITDDDAMKVFESQTVPSSMAAAFASTSSSDTTDDGSDDMMTSDRQNKCRFGYVPATLNALIVGCDHEAYSVLGALNCASQQIRGADMTCTTGGGSAVPTAASSETCWNSIFQLDNILQRNKSAVRSMTELLDCSCAQEPHLAMLYVSIMSKILAGYQVVAQQLPTLAPLATSTQSNSACAPRAGDRDVSRLQPNSTCIRIGSFELDDIDQAALHRQLLLIEICKVDGVIDKMLTTSHQHSKSDRDISLAMSWYHLACLATKRKLQETKDMVNVTVNDYQFRLT